MKDIETNPLYSKSNSEVKEYYKQLVPYLTVKSFDCPNEIDTNNINIDKIVDEYYREYIEYRKIEYEYMEELQIKKRAIEVKNEYYGDYEVLNNRQLKTILIQKKFMKLVIL